ncbi:MAG: class I SAM-dependent methyltransferase [Planctomycetaceae bacterium]|nr:class I SAM-dependent methyltransferase [Planctomycetaceae bacterium]
MSQSLRSLSPGLNSYQQAIQRFDQPLVAAEYPDVYGNSWKDRAERASILSALAGVPAGAAVLDLPCGSGRLTSMLIERGYAVTAADSSPNMVARAQGSIQRIAKSQTGNSPNVRFDVRDVMHTEFRDGEFDAVVCNRLFHHFTEPALRQTALKELRRICQGPIIVSFFNSFAVDSLRFRLRWLLRGQQPTDRIPISLSTFTADGHAAGLTVERTVATRWGISPMWYVVFRRIDQ